MIQLINWSIRVILRQFRIHSHSHAPVTPVVSATRIIDTMPTIANAGAAYVTAHIANERDISTTVVSESTYEIDNTFDPVFMSDLIQHDIQNDIQNDNGMVCNDNDMGDDDPMNTMMNDIDESNVTTVPATLNNAATGTIHTGGRRRRDSTIPSSSPEPMSPPPSPPRTLITSRVMRMELVVQSGSARSMR